MNYIDPPHIITGLEELLPYAVPSRHYDHLVVEVSLEKISFDKDIDYLLSLLNNGITISHLNLINCRLGTRFGELIESLAEKCVSGLHFKFTKSLRNNKELNTLISCSSLYIKSLDLSLTVPLDINKALVHYSCMNQLSSLTINNCSISLETATTVYEWLQTKGSSLAHLSLRNCGLGMRNAEALHVILSGLVGNRSLEGLDLSGNTFTGDSTLEACLGVMECPSLKSLWLDGCKIEAQVCKPLKLYYISSNFWNLSVRDESNISVCPVVTDGVYSRISSAAVISPLFVPKSLHDR
jgi:Ran GTPase-activating protein (RanGAP) involved in mRNA processing and transport